MSVLNLAELELELAYQQFLLDCELSIEEINNLYEMEIV